MVSCPKCGSCKVGTRIIPTPVTRYDEVAPRVWLSNDLVVPIPVRTCERCAYEWTDTEAEHVMQHALDETKP